MGGRFGKYGDLKRRKALQRGRREKSKVERANLIALRNRGGLFPPAQRSSLPYAAKSYKSAVVAIPPDHLWGPVQGLRNAKYIGRYAKDELWEYRILVIPKINEEEIKPLCCFIADIDADLPVCFLSFRPNYALEHHFGATAELMDRCVSIAKKSGLKNAYWSGQTGIPGLISAPQKKVVSAYQMDGGRLAGAYAYGAGCRTHVRNCTTCSSHQTCPVKRYVPQIQP